MTILLLIIILCAQFVQPAYSSDYVFFTEGFPIPSGQSGSYGWGTGTANYVDSSESKFGSNSWKCDVNTPADWSGVGIWVYPLYDTAADYSNNYLIFWVKGENGGESFRVKLADSDSDASGTNDYCYDTIVIVDNYTTGITTLWQKIIIPLIDFPTNGENWDDGLHTGTIEWENIQHVKFTVVDSDPCSEFTIYVDNIIITTNINDTVKPVIISPLSVNTNSIDLTSMPLEISCSFNEKALWELIITGSNSSAYKTYQGFGMNVNISWPGDADKDSPYFVKENCSVVITAEDLFGNKLDSSTTDDTTNFSILESLVYYIKVNQEGYRSGGEKLAIVSCATDRKDSTIFSNIDSSIKFVVKDSGDNSIYSNSLIGPIIDSEAGDVVYKADFSSVNNTGSDFYIFIPYLGNSYKFKINNSPYENVFIKSMKSYYFQRCGTALESTYAGQWSRGVCHSNDAKYLPEDGGGQSTNIGGWHDAGDYGKKMMTVGITVDTILLLCEFFLDEIDSINLNIPDCSITNLPDILNEIKYELDWVFTMQETNGSVHHELIPQNFQFSMPDAENPDRYLWKLSSFATADFAGLMAIASRIFRNYDTNYADLCLEKAEKAWDYLEANPSVFPAGGITSGWITIGYKDTDDSDERFWAAAELYRTTGKDKYNNYVVNNVKYDFSSVYWQDVYMLGVIAYIFSDHPNINNTVKNNLKIAYLNAADTIVNDINNNPYRMTLKPGEFYWGSNRNTLSDAMILAIAYSLTLNIKYLKAAEDQLHYILGRNPMGICYVTGAGLRSTRNIHHHPSQYDGISEPVPGLLALGPNEYRDDAVLQALDPATPPSKCYVDVFGSYAGNENSIDGNAPLVFVSGYLHFNKDWVGVDPPSNPDDDKKEEDDSQTNIFKDLKQAKAGPVPYKKGIDSGGIHFVNLPLTTKIQIFTVSGLHIKTLKGVNTQNELVWDIKNDSHHNVASGVYICVLKDNKGHKKIIKVILLK